MDIETIHLEKVSDSLYQKRYINDLNHEVIKVICIIIKPDADKSFIVKNFTISNDEMPLFNLSHLSLNFDSKSTYSHREHLFIPVENNQYIDGVHLHAITNPNIRFSLATDSPHNVRDVAILIRVLKDIPKIIRDKVHHSYFLDYGKNLKYYNDEHKVDYGDLVNDIVIISSGVNLDDISRVEILSDNKVVKTFDEEQLDWVSKRFGEDRLCIPLTNNTVETGMKVCLNNAFCFKRFINPAIKIYDDSGYTIDGMFVYLSIFKMIIYEDGKVRICNANEQPPMVYNAPVGSISYPPRVDTEPKLPDNTRYPELYPR